jgi:hypothetical protein
MEIQYLLVLGARIAAREHVAWANYSLSTSRETSKGSGHTEDMGALFQLATIHCERGAVEPRTNQEIGILEFLHRSRRRARLRCH